MRVNPEKCIGCGSCIAHCPVDAIRFEQGKAFIDKSICIQCGMCASICPVEAIDNE